MANNRDSSIDDVSLPLLPPEVVLLTLENASVDVLLAFMQINPACRGHVYLRPTLINKLAESLLNDIVAMDRMKAHMAENNPMLLSTMSFSLSQHRLFKPVKIALDNQCLENYPETKNALNQLITAESDKIKQQEADRIFQLTMRN